jgi:hemoglobin-like flavoprotein
MVMDEAVLKTFGESLRRCNSKPEFLDRFYERFLASSPKVREKFANTDFVRQKRALRESLHMMLLVAEDEEKGPDQHLGYIAARHSKAQLDIGAELYDLWLDSLLHTVGEFDPEFNPKIEEAWERVMNVGIRYLLSHYHDAASPTPQE